MRIIITYVLSGWVLCIAQAQSPINFDILVSDELRPVAGALVTAKSLVSGQESYAITDANGLSSIPFRPPVVLEVSHLSYRVFSDTIADYKPLKITLTPADKMLEEVVVTGQLGIQSAQRSVYTVKSIDQSRIRAQGATNIQDVLSSELNVRFSRDNATGASGISLQGLSGQYVKVLVDGVPLVGRSGVNNEVDLNQINVNNIHRIEIVEGPMAVSYGADALAGVINIITHQDSGERFQADVSWHQETVGREFSYFDKGVHTPSLNLSWQTAKNWRLGGNLRVNRFGGWQGDGIGRDKDWYPKTQQFAGGFVGFSRKQFDLRYQFDYMQELLENQGPANDNNPLKDPFAIDEEYQATRVQHQLQGNFDIGKAELNSVLSYTDYERTSLQFVKNLLTENETRTDDWEQDTVFYKSLFFRTTINNMLKWRGVGTQIGVDGTFDEAGGTTLSSGTKSIHEIGFYMVSELELFSSLYIRPGFRYNYNSVFNNSPTFSLQFKYDLGPRSQFRAGYGRGFRAPSIRELFHEFIDSNHNIVGNDELEPEYSHNLNADFSYKLIKLPISFKIAAFFNDVDNQITFFSPEQANQPTTYQNIEKYKTTGGTLTMSVEKAALKVQSGVSLIGRYQRLNELQTADVPQFVFAPEANLQLTYQWEEKGWTIATFYKYSGSTKNYQLLGSGETASVELREMEDFSLWDVTVAKSWNAFTINTGVRNLLDVTTIANNQSGVHGGGSQTSIAYGRSYFLQLNYQIHKAK